MRETIDHVSDREAPFVSPRCDLVPLENMRIRQDSLNAPHVEPLTDPVWVSVQDATEMRSDDPVLGFHVDSQPYAIPWWIMKNHHVANLTLDDRPLVVKLCEVCTSSGAFDPVVDGRRLTFMVKGAYKGTFVTMDFETGSIWAPFLGQALLGPLEGTRLERQPVFQSRWAEWSSLYPETLVPDGADETREGHGADRRPGSFESPDGLSHTLVHHDERLPHTELVLGVECGDDARAYPLRALAGAGRALNDRLGRMPIVVFSRPGSWMAVAFSREVDGMELEFSAADGDEFVDAQTQSRWNLLGRAVGGALRDRSLAFVRSGIEEWNAWASYHPQTEIFEGA
jgi:hypothetical protein